MVCPASLLANWEREFARFAPGVAVRRYHGAGRSLDGLAPGRSSSPRTGPCCATPERLAEVRWDLVVADEAQQVKNHRSQAARRCGPCPAVRIAVTGTPVENSLSELWAILDWTNPGLFGTLAAFRERVWPGGRAGGPGGDARRARLGRLIAPFLMRRRKTDPDIVPELPEKVVSARYVELTREQAALYQAATADTLARIRERRHRSPGPGAPAAPVAAADLQLARAFPPGAGRLGRRVQAPGRQARGAGGADGLGTAAGEAALIFTGYVSMGHLIQAHLAARGMPAGFLHGATPAARRQEVVDRFQSGQGDALILSVRAAGTGLNLTRAGHVIHFDRPWNPAVEDQATDRAHRIGQPPRVNVHHLIAREPWKTGSPCCSARKRGLTEAVLAGGGDAR